jgi:hypothetical protein
MVLFTWLQRKANPKPAVVTYIVAVVLLAAALTANAQQYPVFPAGTENTSIQVFNAPGLAAYGSGLYTNALFMAYPATNGFVYTAFTTDGRNYTDQGEAIDHSNGQTYHVACDATVPPTCGTPVAVFNGTAYIAYVNYGDHGLAVVAVTKIPGNAAYSYHLVYYSPSLSPPLTSTPAMTVSPDGLRLLIRYGTSPSNSTYTTSYNGSTWSTVASGSNAPNQSALVVFQGTLYAIDKQNNSNNGVWVSKLDNNGVYISGTGHQIPNWFTSQGFSGIVYNNSSIVVTYASNDSSHTLDIAASSDGTNWTLHTQGGSIGGPAAITNWDNQVPLAFRNVSSPPYLWTSIAPN